MKKRTTMTAKELEAILKQHRVRRNYWPQMKALVFYGKRPCANLIYRLHNVDNYVACLVAILDELSRPLTARFPTATAR